jgi:hypothetical protein
MTFQGIVRSHGFCLILSLLMSSLKEIDDFNDQLAQNLAKLDAAESRDPPNDGLAGKYTALATALENRLAGLDPPGQTR